MANNEDHRQVPPAHSRDAASADERLFRRDEVLFRLQARRQRPSRPSPVAPSIAPAVIRLPSQDPGRWEDRS